MAANASTLDKLKAALDFRAEDEQRLPVLREPLEPHLPEIVERFYDALNLDGQAARILSESGTPLDRLRATLLDWLRETLTGPYDEAYADRRLAIGQAHVRVQLPQHYMCVGISLTRQAILSRIAELKIPDHDALAAAVNKVLDLDLVLMLESYRDEMIARLGEAERSALQQKLDESEHLANVGQLAATLAHEIKNPLAGISGAIQVIGSSMPEGSPHKEVINEILSEIDRLDATARDLLIYARPKPPRRKNVKVGPLLERVLSELRKDPGVQTLEVEALGLDCTAEARIDENQFRQVITNLVLNAVHACDGNGRLTFRLSVGGGRVTVEITDTGTGIPPERMSQLFEPFYTTKAKGTGLGLNICKWIVESHGGTLSLESRPGEGTTATVELPSKR